MKFSLIQSIILKLIEDLRKMFEKSPNRGRGVITSLTPLSARNMNILDIICFQDLSGQPQKESLHFFQGFSGMIFIKYKCVTKLQISTITFEAGRSFSVAHTMLHHFCAFLIPVRHGRIFCFKLFRGRIATIYRKIPIRQDGSGSYRFTGFYGSRRTARE